MLEIGNIIIVLPVKSREVHIIQYQDNYVMRYCHQSVGVISQSFLNLRRLLHSGYERYKHTVYKVFHTQSLKYIPEERSYSD